MENNDDTVITNKGPNVYRRTKRLKKGVTKTKRNFKTKKGGQQPESSENSGFFKNFFSFFE
jgi:hypothetical protein